MRLAAAAEGCAGAPGPLRSGHEAIREWVAGKRLDGEAPHLDGEAPQFEAMLPGIGTAWKVLGGGLTKHRAGRTPPGWVRRHPWIAGAFSVVLLSVVRHVASRIRRLWPQVRDPSDLGAFVDGQERLPWIGFGGGVENAASALLRIVPDHPQIEQPRSGWTASNRRIGHGIGRFRPLGLVPPGVAPTARLARDDGDDANRSRGAARRRGPPAPRSHRSEPQAASPVAPSLPGAAGRAAAATRRPRPGGSEPTKLRGIGGVGTGLGAREARARRLMTPRPPLTPPAARDAGGETTARRRRGRATARESGRRAPRRIRGSRP